MNECLFKHKNNIKRSLYKHIHTHTYIYIYIYNNNNNTQSWLKSLDE